MRYPAIINNLINHFSRLPGIGQKTAERLVFYLLKQGKEEDLLEFGRALALIKKSIKLCAVCNGISENGVCNICSDSKRDKSTICIVAEAQDVFYLDKTDYHGTYHVLGGLISPAEKSPVEKLNFSGLLERLTQNKNVSEIILGINPTVEGETTMLYAKKLVSEKFSKIKITRLSRGLPMGADLEYADEITLASAIRNRNEM